MEIIPNKKIFAPKKTEERLFRPCIAMVHQNINKYPKVEGIKIVRHPRKEENDRPGKKIAFPYLEEKHNLFKEKQSKQSSGQVWREELNLMTTVGFNGRKHMETLTSFNKTFSTGMGKNRFQGNQKKEDFNFGSGEKYVQSLKNWENNFLKK